METYKKRLEEKANKDLKKYNIKKYEYSIILEYIKSNYEDNRKGFLSYLENAFFKKCIINLDDYNKLIDIAYKVRNVRKKSN